MISYEQVISVLSPPPTEDIIDLYNRLDLLISKHPKCVNDKNPFSKLQEGDTFCISATSIQSRYIAFVLGKSTSTVFPHEVINLFFDIDSDYRVQFGKISGEQIDGCICLIHQEDSNYSLQTVYDEIYK